MKTIQKDPATRSCPCGSDVPYSGCCGRYLDGNAGADTAVALMRSRYAAYVLRRETYLLGTWHPTTRPTALSLGDETKWLGLQVLRHERRGDDQALVEFVARYKVDGRANRLHEISRFVHQDGRWFYVAGRIVEPASRRGDAAGSKPV